MECRAWDAGFGVQGLGCRVWGAGFGVQSSGWYPPMQAHSARRYDPGCVAGEGLGFEVKGLGFGVKG